MLVLRESKNANLKPVKTSHVQTQTSATNIENVSPVNELALPITCLVWTECQL